ncbi:MAG: ATP-grasp domain-containing protein [Candidatus Helarchaeota archaeon]
MKNEDLLIISNNLDNYETKRILEELTRLKVSFITLPWKKISLPFNLHPKVCLIRSLPDLKKNFAIPYFLTFIEELERNGCTCIPSSKDFYFSDKGTILLIARKLGIQIPSMIIGEDIDKISLFIKSHEKVVYKPMIGSKGEGIQLFSQNSDQTLKEIINKDSIIYLQEFIENKKYDIRTIFINGAMICQFIRENKDDFRYNVSLGGVAHNYKEYIEKDEFLKAFLKKSELIGDKIYSETKMKMFGIDTIPSISDELYFLEINPILGFEGAETATKKNVAEEIARLITLFLE